MHVTQLLFSLALYVRSPCGVSKVVLTQEERAGVTAAQAYVGPLPALHSKLYLQRLVSEFPLLRDTFLVLDAKGWRIPRVNETCCARPSLAKLLQDGARVL